MSEGSEEAKAPALRPVEDDVAAAAKALAERRAELSAARAAWAAQRMRALDGPLLPALAALGTTPTREAVIRGRRDHLGRGIRPETVDRVRTIAAARLPVAGALRSAAPAEPTPREVEELVRWGNTLATHGDAMRSFEDARAKLEGATGAEVAALVGSWGRAAAGALLARARDTAETARREHDAQRGVAVKALAELPAAAADRLNAVRDDANALKAELATQSAELARAFGGLEAVSGTLSVELDAEHAALARELFAIGADLGRATADLGAIDVSNAPAPPIPPLASDDLAVMERVVAQAERSLAAIHQWDARVRGVHARIGTVLGGLDGVRDRIRAAMQGLNGLGVAIKDIETRLGDVAQALEQLLVTAKALLDRAATLRDQLLDAQLRIAEASQRLSWSAARAALEAERVRRLEERVRGLDVAKAPDAAAQDLHAVDASLASLRAATGSRMDLARRLADRLHAKVASLALADPAYGRELSRAFTDTVAAMGAGHTVVGATDAGFKGQVDGGRWLLEAVGPGGTSAFLTIEPSAHGFLRSGPAAAAGSLFRLVGAGNPEGDEHPLTVRALLGGAPLTLLGVPQCVPVADPRERAHAKARAHPAHFADDRGERWLTVTSGLAEVLVDAPSALLVRFTGAAGMRLLAWQRGSQHAELLVIAGRPVVVRDGLVAAVGPTLPASGVHAVHVTLVDDTVSMHVVTQSDAADTTAPVRSLDAEWPGEPAGTPVMKRGLPAGDGWHPPPLEDPFHGGTGPLALTTQAPDEPFEHPDGVAIAGWLRPLPGPTAISLLASVQLGDSALELHAGPSAAGARPLTLLLGGTELSAGPLPSVEEGRWRHLALVLEPTGPLPGPVATAADAAVWEISLYVDGLAVHVGLALARGKLRVTAGPTRAGQDTAHLLLWRGACGASTIARAYLRPSAPPRVPAFRRYPPPAAASAPPADGLASSGWPALATREASEGESGLTATLVGNRYGRPSFRLSEGKGDERRWLAWSAERGFWSASDPAAACEIALRARVLDPLELPEPEKIALAPAVDATGVAPHTLSQALGLAPVTAAASRMRRAWDAVLGAELVREVARRERWVTRLRAAADEAAVYLRVAGFEVEAGMRRRETEAWRSSVRALQLAVEGGFSALTFERTGAPPIEQRTPLGPEPVRAFTASCWIKLDTISALGTIVALEVAGGGAHPMVLRVGRSGPAPGAKLRLDVCGAAFEASLALDAEWHHLAVSWRADTGIATVFVDARERAKGPVARGGAIHGGCRLLLGRSNLDVPTRGIHAKLEQVAFWSVERGAAALAAEMARGLTGLEEGLRWLACNTTARARPLLYTAPIDSTPLPGITISADICVTAEGMRNWIARYYVGDHEDPLLTLLVGRHPGKAAHGLFLTVGRGERTLPVTVPVPIASGWRRLTVTWDCTTLAVVLYVDGKVVRIGEKDAQKLPWPLKAKYPPFPSEGRWVLGGSPDADDVERAQATLRRVAVWRSAFSAKEVESEFYTGPRGHEQGLVALYRRAEEPGWQRAERGGAHLGDPKVPLPPGIRRAPAPSTVGIDALVAALDQRTPETSALAALLGAPPDDDGGVEQVWRALDRHGLRPTRAALRWDLGMWRTATGVWRPANDATAVATPSARLAALDSIGVETRPMARTADVTELVKALLDPDRPRDVLSERGWSTVASEGGDAERGGAEPVDRARLEALQALPAWEAEARLRILGFEPKFRAVAGSAEVSRAALVRAVAALDVPPPIGPDLAALARSIQFDRRLLLPLLDAAGAGWLVEAMRRGLLPDLETAAIARTTPGAPPYWSRLERPAR